MKHSTMNEIRCVEARHLTALSYVVTVECMCGYLITATCTTPTIAWRTIERKLAAHARA